MNPKGYPVSIGGVKIGELDRIEERDGEWIIHWHITDVEAAQRTGVDVLSMMPPISAPTALRGAAEKIGEAMG